MYREITFVTERHNSLKFISVARFHKKLGQATGFQPCQRRERLISLRDFGKTFEKRTHVQSD